MAQATFLSSARPRLLSIAAGFFCEPGDGLVVHVPAVFCDRGSAHARKAGLRSLFVAFAERAVPQRRRQCDRLSTESHTQQKRRSIFVSSGAARGGQTDQGG